MKKNVFLLLLTLWVPLSLTADEEENVLKAKEQLLKLQKIQGRMRAFHAAGVCLRGGVLKVNPTDNRDSRSVAGIFKEEREFTDVWIRFSPGIGRRKRPQYLPDVLGVAIGMDVDGQRLDFLATNTSTPVTPTAELLLEFGKATADLFAVLNVLPRFMNTNRDVLKLFVEELAAPKDSFLTETYWSGHPYKLGSSDAKFQIRMLNPPEVTPIEAELPRSPFELEKLDFGGVVRYLTLLTKNLFNLAAEGVKSDYLTQGLVDYFKENSGTFSIGYQFFSDEKTTPLRAFKAPISRAGIMTPWSGPVVEVAKIVIQKQDAKVNAKACEQRVFSPKTKIPAHQGVGRMAKMRSVLYKESENYRK